jgi:cytidylate kinase
MDKQIMITVGREHGSGGHYIAQLIAEQLNIQLYDKQIVEGTTLTSGYSKEIVDKMDEKPVNFFFSRKIGPYSNSLEENVAEMTFNYINCKAMSGESFVVVGRCAEQVLKDYPNVIKIFIEGNRDVKIKRIMGIENVSEAEAEGIMKEVDRRRKTYHNYYCEHKWGDSRGYDIVANSSRLGLEKTADVLTYCIRAYMDL